MLWGWPFAVWELVVKISLWTAVGAGVITAVAAFLAGYIGYELTDAIQKISEENVALARKDAALAQAEAARANEASANANEAAASAKERTALAELRLEEMRRRLGPRDIDREPFLQALANRPKKPVTVSVVEDDADSYVLAHRILDLLEEAGWQGTYKTSTDRRLKGCGQGLGGVVVMAKTISDEENSGWSKAPTERPQTPMWSLLGALREALADEPSFATCSALPDGVLQIVITPRFAILPK